MRDSHAYRVYTGYAWGLCISTVTPDPLRGIRKKRFKRMRPKKGATFLPERYYLSRSLQPPFSGNIHQICYPIGRILIVTQITQITQIFFRPPDSFSRQQMTTITTFNGDTVAKGRVILVVIVVHVVVNSKLLL